MFQLKVEFVVKNKENGQQEASGFENEYDAINWIMEQDLRDEEYKFPEYLIEKVYQKIPNW